MAKVEQDIYWTELHPSALQDIKMRDMVKATEYTYNFAIEGLASNKYKLTEDNIFDVLHDQILADWIDQRPDTDMCPKTMMAYVARDACNNWLDNRIEKLSVEELKDRHKNKLYIPYSGMSIANNSVQIMKIMRVPIDPIYVPTRIHLIIAHMEPDKWRCEIRAARYKAN